MKKLTAILLACFLLVSVAFASPIVPLGGFEEEDHTLSSGQTWTSNRYYIPSSDTTVYLDVSIQSGGNVTAELYGVNSSSGSGTKVGSINTATKNKLNVPRNYTYYYVKVVNSSGIKSTVSVSLTSG